MSSKKDLYLAIPIAIIITVAIAVMCRSKSESYQKCICSQRRERICQNLSTNVGLDWSTVSPGDCNFPISKGCIRSKQRPTCEKSRPWTIGDFTDF